MAFIRGSAGGGGGELTPTTLWVNLDPSQSMASGGGDLPLYDDISNYRYIRITVRIRTTNADETSYIVAVNDVKATSAPASVDGFLVSTPTILVSGYSYVRRIYYVNDRKLHFLDAAGVNVASTSVNYAIITKIEGLNFN